MKTNLFDLSGKATEVTLPKALFEVKVSEATMTQVLRVLNARQHTGEAQAQTRSEVDRTTAKVYAQKHTGRARHGSRSAPIYVGGGQAHGPRARFGAPLRLTRKLRRLSVLGTLSMFAAKKSVSLVEKLDMATPKAAALAAFFKKVAGTDKVVVLTDKSYPEFQKAAGNLKNVSLLPAKAANALSLLKAKHLLIDQAALPSMEAWLVKTK